MDIRAINYLLNGLKKNCYRWLHNQSEKYYRVRNYAFTIPVIILFYFNWYC